ncbi:hypothetical protein ASPCAL01587 [Aspergillus calidoustus]|uniref:Uncharacterized protein n=1 Tax=Aspergillus calidoustus TaxID=454130 RepID=A0A0U5C370_ASPCI|nr:hypothetical protein ASPCAL01587 [Aspergillus calidoustus]
MELRYLDLETMAKILFSLLRQISNYPRSLDPYALSRAMRVSSPSPSAMSSTGTRRATTSLSSARSTAAQQHLGSAKISHGIAIPCTRTSSKSLRSTFVMFMVASSASRLDAGSPGRTIAIGILRAMRGRVSFKSHSIMSAIHSLAISNSHIHTPCHHPPAHGGSL